MTLDTTQHPCFNENAKHKFGRIHLPVAPKCNIQCNFCDRKYDCVNENRPGVTSTVLTPNQALAYLHKMVEMMPNIAVVGIAGPGDPFANPDETMETLRLVRRDFPNMLLCVASNGLNAAPYIEELVKLQVTHLTLTITAVDPEISQKVYAWVRDGKKIYRGRHGAEVLLSRQLETLALCRQYGLTTKINCIHIPGINDHHITEVARFVAQRGANLFNSMPMCHVPDTPFENIVPPGKEEVEAVRHMAERYLPQMRHCTRCRADAVGCLGQGTPQVAIDIMQQIVAGKENSSDRPYVAVASMEGVLINQHLGHADEVFIYGVKDNKPVLIETRKTPQAGDGDIRWLNLADTLKDCQAFFVSQAGGAPVRVMESKGIKIVKTEGLIEPTLTDFFAGKPVLLVSKPSACQSGCAKAGSKAGCGCA